MIDPDRLMEVLEKHGETVTLSLLCDLMPVIGVRMRMEKYSEPGTCLRPFGVEPLHVSSKAASQG